jgi:hypothetical protein
MTPNIQNISIYGINWDISVADPEISKRGGGAPKTGAHPTKLQKIHVFWVSNFEFY